MKLKILTQEGLDLLEHNIPANIKHYQKPTNDWIYEFLDKDHIKEFHTEVLGFKLKAGEKDVSKMEVENVKILYTNLKFLTDEQAADPRFWVGLTHLNFWEFIHKRWNVGEEEQTEVNIKGRYFLGMTRGHRRSLIDNAISKYWWIARKIYDDRAEDPLHLLKYFEVDYSTKVVDLLSRNYTNNSQTLKNIVESFLELEKKTGRRVSREESRDIIRYLNIVGGVSALDCLSEDELKEKIKTRFYK